MNKKVKHIVVCETTTKRGCWTKPAYNLNEDAGKVLKKLIKKT
jgi:hypothetical protein